MRFWGILLVFAIWTTGCSSELHHGLDEATANEMVTVLQRNGVEATKIVDPTDPKAWAVTVPSGVQVESMTVLQRQGLPRPAVDGFQKFYPREGLVPTNDEERIIVQYATGQELRRALLAIDGVVDAHVNLVLPETPRLRLAREEMPPPRAAVLIKFRPGKGGAAPVVASDVQRLIAGGVDRMTPAQVEVVMTPVTIPAEGQNIAMTQVGPVSVAATNKFTLQALVGVLVMLVLGLTAGLAFVLLRKR